MSVAFSAKSVANGAEQVAAEGHACMIETHKVQERCLKLGRPHVQTSASGESISSLVISQDALLVGIV